jgi:hypothetical protein
VVKITKARVAVEVAAQLRSRGRKFGEQVEARLVIRRLLQTL